MALYYNQNENLYGDDARKEVLFPKEDVTVQPSTPLFSVDDQPLASKLYMGFVVWSLNHKIKCTSSLSVIL